jgi:hypothetical protein
MLNLSLCFVHTLQHLYILLFGFSGDKCIALTKQWLKQLFVT